MEYPRSSLAGVIFGAKMSREDRVDLRKVVESTGFKDVIFYKAKKKSKQYKLDVVLI